MEGNSSNSKNLSIRHSLIIMDYWQLQFWLDRLGATVPWRRITFYGEIRGPMRNETPKDLSRDMA